MLHAKNAMNKQISLQTENLTRKDTKGKLTGSKKAYAVVIMMQIIKDERINLDANDLMKYGFTDDERTSKEQIESARKNLLKAFPSWKKYDTPTTLMPSFCKKLEISEELTQDA